MATERLKFAKESKLTVYPNNKCNCKPPEFTLRIIGAHNTHYCNKCMEIFSTIHLSKADYLKEIQPKLL